MYSIAYHTHRKVSSYVPPPSLVAWDLLSSGERLGAAYVSTQSRRCVHDIRRCTYHHRPTTVN